MTHSLLKRINNGPSLGILVIACALIFGYLLGEQQYLRITEATGADYPADTSVSSDTESKTGYERDQRRLILPNRNDTYHWILNTQERVDQGFWRLREVDYDNAPEGREVHWSSLHSWWIEAVSELFPTLSKGEAISHSALISNPISVGVVFATLGIYLAFRFGTGPCIILAAGYLGLAPFREYFEVGNGDHHAPVSLAALLCILFLALGVNKVAFRRYFVLSAVLGAIGLALNAVSMLVVLFGLHIAILVGCRLQYFQHDPAKWRLWGIVGFTSSLLLYLIEYLPHYLGFRLETNHPMWGLAWLGGAELITIYGNNDGLGQAWSDRGKRLRIIISFVFIFLAPCTILISGSSVFAPLDPFLKALHDDYLIEFQSALTNISVMSPLTALAKILPALALGYAWVRIFYYKGNDRVRAVALLLVIPASILLFVTLLQARWWGLCYSIVWLTVPLSIATIRSPKRPYICAGLLLLYIPGIALSVQDFMKKEDLDQATAYRIAERSIAYQLSARAGSDEMIVLSGPNTTSALNFFGSIQGLGTLYWENAKGLERAAEQFAAETKEEIRRLHQENGVTHVVFLPWDTFESEYVKLHRIANGESHASGESFIQQSLAKQSIPFWLRPIPVFLPQIPQLNGPPPLVFEIVYNQSPEDGYADHVEAFLEMGWIDLAGRYRNRLESAADNPRCQIALARLLISIRQISQFETVVSQLIQNHRQFDSLRTEDQIRLAAIFETFDRKSLARQYALKAHQDISEDSLRKMSPVTLRQLLNFEDQLGIRFKNPDLKEFAKGLLPEFMR